MRQHYKHDHKPMPYWLEHCLDIASAIIMGVLFAALFFVELSK
jgi:hypothetical protein